VFFELPDIHSDVTGKGSEYFPDLPDLSVPVFGPFYSLVQDENIHSLIKRRKPVIPMIKAPMINIMPTILTGREADPSWVKTIPTITAPSATSIA